MSLGVYVYAQDSVTLIVSGEGANKENAINSALNNAIEQAYGISISSSKEIINDESISDEINSMLSGNITEYKEVACVNLNSSVLVTLSVTLPAEKPVSLATNKSMASGVNFSGNSFMLDVKVLELSKANEKEAIKKMVQQLEFLSRDMFQIELSSIEKPQKIVNRNDYLLTLSFDYYPTSSSDAFYSLLINTVKALAMTDEEIINFKKHNERIYKLCITELTEIPSSLHLETQELEKKLAYLLSSDPYSPGGLYRHSFKRRVMVEEQIFAIKENKTKRIGYMYTFDEISRKRRPDDHNKYTYEDDTPKQDFGENKTYYFRTDALSDAFASICNAINSANNNSNMLKITKTDNSDKETHTTLKFNPSKIFAKQESAKGSLIIYNFGKYVTETTTLFNAVNKQNEKIIRDCYHIPESVNIPPEFYRKRVNRINKLRSKAIEKQQIDYGNIFDKNQKCSTLTMNLIFSEKDLAEISEFRFTTVPFKLTHTK